MESTATRTTYRLWGKQVPPERRQVLERGAPRLFRRLAEGILDEADVRGRADDLAEFVAQALTAYSLTTP
jgi:phospholipase/carboxylesterase